MAALRASWKELAIDSLWIWTGEGRWGLNLVVGRGKEKGGARGKGERMCVKIVAKPAVALWTAESWMMNPTAQLQGRLCMLILGFRLEQGISKLRQ